MEISEVVDSRDVASSLVKLNKLKRNIYVFSICFTVWIKSLRLFDKIYRKCWTAQTNTWNEFVKLYEKWYLVKWMVKLKWDEWSSYYGHKFFIPLSWMWLKKLLEKNNKMNRKQNLNLPAVIPRTCTLFGSSGGVNVGAGWWSSEKWHNISQKTDPLDMRWHGAIFINFNQEAIWAKDFFSLLQKKLN